jgi:hypothetical protein
VRFLALLALLAVAFALPATVARGVEDPFEPAYDRSKLVRYIRALRSACDREDFDSDRLTAAVEAAHRADALAALEPEVANKIARRADCTHTAQLVLALGQAWQRLHAHHRALAWLGELGTRWPQSTSTSVGHLIEAQIFRADHAPRRMLDALRAAAASSSLDTHRSVMDADNTQNIARRWLGRELEARGAWREANQIYREWRPRSWCGNEAAEYAQERELALARTARHLSRESRAVAR